VHSERFAEGPHNLELEERRDVPGTMTRAG
jgi:hypothetical protein